jgi:hypothetical protein
MLIDTLGERYGMLPSQVISQASTFDIFVADTAIGYRNYLQDKADGKNKPYNPSDYTQDDLLKIMGETRGTS